jgi:sulfate adenylyltransferase
MTTWQDMLHEPTYALDGAALDNLELLLGGLLGPAAAFSLPGRAPAGAPAELTLAVPAAVAAAAEELRALLLTDPDGTPLARLTVDASEPNPDGTAHLGGRVEALQRPEHGSGRDIRMTTPVAGGPDQGPAVVAAFDHQPRPEQLARAVTAAREAGAGLQLVALADSAAAGDRDLAALLAALRACADELPDTAARLLVVPGFRTSAIGGDSTVGAYVLHRLGAAEVLDFTGAGATPSGAAASGAASGLVVLFTGLSGSGKSTVARALVEQIHAVDARKALLLDGDDVRRFLTAGLGFSREDRNTNVERIGWVASLVSAAGGIAVCAPIAPFEESRARVREFAERAGDYLLVHVSTPLEICEQRDRKGLYAKARSGLIPDFTGIDSPYESPEDADLVVDTSQTSVDDAVAMVLQLVAGPEHAS